RLRAPTKVSASALARARARARHTPALAQQRRARPGPALASVRAVARRNGAGGGRHATQHRSEPVAGGAAGDLARKPAGPAQPLVRGALGSLRRASVRRRLGAKPVVAAAGAGSELRSRRNARPPGAPPAEHDRPRGRKAPARALEVLRRSLVTGVRGNRFQKRAPVGCCLAIISLMV